MEQYFRTRASVDDDPDLAQNRRANDARLKSRFEHIFEKYGKDFEGVGDEIDLETGSIVVNNGHLARMRHEVDPGQGASSQVLRVMQGSLQDEVGVHGDGFVIEDSTEELDDTEELVATTTTSGDSDSEAADEEDAEGTQTAGAAVSDELSSDFFPTRDATPEKSRRSAQTWFETKSAGKRRLNSDQVAAQTRTTSHREFPEDQLTDLPFLEESVKSVQALPGQSGFVDPDAIQALGQSIAKQLARYMNVGSRKSKRISPERTTSRDSRWEFPTLPGDNIDRTPSPPLPRSASAALFTASPGREASIWAPQRQRRKRKPRLQSRLIHDTTVADGDGDDDDDVDPLQSDPPTQTEPGNHDEPEDAIPTDCYNCGTTNSRAWRTGPDGRLCDSCGAYFRKYGLLKAVEDPSSTPAPRPRLRSLTAERRLPAHGKGDVFAIPSTDAAEATAGYAANTARRISADGRKGRFTLEEEECIIRLHEIDGIAWDHIGFLISHRTAYAVHSHYQKSLKGADCEARQRLLHKSVPVRTFGISAVAMSQAPDSSEQDDQQSGGIEAFTTSENETMSQLREQEGMTWAEIAGYLPGRTSHELQAHYNEHLAKGTLPSPIPDLIDPALVDSNIQPAFDNGSSSAAHKEANPAKVSNCIPYTTEEDALLLKTRDDQAMSFAQMTGYLIDRTEENIVDRYLELKARQNGGDTAEHASSIDTLDPTVSAVTDAPIPARSALDLDGRTRMLPPPRPSRASSRRKSASSSILTASGQRHDEESMGRAESQSSISPHTPSLQALPVNAPPKNLQVGPSAWAATQPTSKGPLPFQPARKGLAPLRAKSSSRGLYDPFISRTKPPGILTPPSSNATTSQRDTYESEPSSVQRAHSEFTEPLSSSHTTGRKTQSRAVPDTASKTGLVDQSPIPTPVFTPTQDRFITRAREKRSLSWEAIAKALPGDIPHTASAVMHRYYDFLLGRTLPARPHESQETQVGETSERCFTEEESKQVAEYKNAGMSWADMANNIPGRTSVSIQMHYNDTVVKGAHDQSASVHSHHSNTLLHQALRNLARRKSDVVGVGSRLKDGLREIPPPSASSDHSTRASRQPLDTDMRFHGDLSQAGTVHQHEQQFSRHVAEEDKEHASTDQEDEDAILIDNDERDAEPTSPVGRRERTGKLAGAREKTTATLSRRRSSHVATGLNTPQSSTQQGVSNQSSDSSMTGRGSRKRRAKPRPEVVIQVSERDGQNGNAHSNDEPFMNDMEAFVGQVTANTSGDAETHDVDIVRRPRISKKVMTPTGIKRKRTRGRSSRLSKAVVEDSDSDSPSNQLQVEAAGNLSHAAPIATSLIKRGPGRPRKCSLVSSVVPQSTNTLDSSGRPQRKTRRRTLDMNTTVKDAEHTTGGDDDNLTRTIPDSDNEVSDTADQSLACTDCHDALEPTTAAPDLVERADLAYESSNHSGEYERPELDWKEVIYTMLRARPGKELRGREVVAWVRENHPFYRHTGETWVYHVHNAMKRDEGLQRADPDDRLSGYIFKESDIQRATAERESGEDGTNEQPINVELAEDSPTPASPVPQLADASANDQITADEPAEKQSTPSSPASQLAGISANDQITIDGPAENLPTPASPASQLANVSVDDQATNDEPAEGPLTLASPSPLGDTTANDQAEENMPTTAPSPPRLADTSANATEIKGTSSDPLIRQGSGPEGKFANFYARRSQKHSNDEQHSEPRAKHPRYSDTALVKRMSTVTTPSRGGQGRLSLLSRSATAKRFEPLPEPGLKATPGTSAVPSGRRFVIATDVSMDDGDEQDELS